MVFESRLIRIGLDDDGRSTGRPQAAAVLAVSLCLFNANGKTGRRPTRIRGTRL